MLTEEAPAWRGCPARRGQPGAAVRRTVAASLGASAALGVPAVEWAPLHVSSFPGWGAAALAATAVSGGALLAASCLSPHWPGVRRRLPSGHAVALTFDDGPAPETTPRILDALAAHGATATFFVLGAEGARSPGLIARIAAEGHPVGIHGWDHRPMTWVRPSETMDLLRRAQGLVEDITGRPVVLYRPPWGHRGPGLRWALRRLRWRNIGWRIAAGDWRASQPDEVAERLERRLRPRDIVLLHDGGPGADLTADALPRVLGYLAAREMAAVAVPGW